MSLNWNNLRPWDGSQRSAFEELCCQLAGSEDMPNGAKFIRKGAPDAGVECFWKLPNDYEHCWQAKYFLSPPDSNQWDQIDDSVKTALEKHPNVYKYTICLPIDRPDARIEGQKSCLEKWNDHVAKWERWVNDKNMTVEFVFWGESQIFQRLSQEKHRGRYLFWFDKDLLSYQKMLNQIDETIANVGPRYTPELNIHLELSKAFDFIARTEKYTFELRKNIGFFNRKLQSLVTKEYSDSLQDNIGKIKTLGMELIGNLSRLANSAIEIVDLENLSNLLSTLRGLFWDSEKVINKAKSEEHVTKTNNKPEDMTYYHYSEKYDRWLYNIREVRKAIDNLYVFIESNNAQLAMNPAMLLSGPAGSGKTHLLCDLAKERLTQKLPTTFLLGQHFREGEPWEQIIRQLQLNCQTKEELLGILDAAGQATGTRTLILIDAINETYSKKMWPSYLAGILEAVKRYPWVGIVISIRNTYFEYMIPQQLIEERKLIAVPHKGFAGIEYKAMREFFRYYNIKQPDVPLLSPEFQNPLFLKLFCSGLNNLGITEIPRGSQNITKVYENFINSVNNKLSNENILNYDPRDKIVWKTIKGLADKMAERNDSRIPLNEAKGIVHEILPSDGYHNSLFYHLKTEGIITESIMYTEDTCVEAVQFSYERFADHLITKYLLDKHLNVDAPESSFKNGQPLAKLFTTEFSWHYEGLIEAISIQLPEKIGKELIELVPQYAKRSSVQQAFLDSLVWRDPKSTNKKTKDIINDYIIQDNYNQLMETFITVATLKDHPFNADSLHRYLLKHDLPNRDATWSIFLFYQVGENGAVDRLIDWAWSPEDKSHIDDSSILLAAKTLAWFLTTSQRYLRDRATKALVSLLTDRIHIMKELLDEFKSVDDPYVLERLYASAYGCAMRSKNEEEVNQLAIETYNLIFKDGTPPVNISLRGYARCLVELGLDHNPDLDIDVNNVRPPYHSKWPENIPAKDDVRAKYKIPYHDKTTDEERGQGRIVFSVLDWDFARYIIGTNSGYSNWSSRRLGVQREPTNREIYEAFFGSLNARQKDYWEKFEKVKRRVRYFSVSGIDDMKLSLGWKTSSSKVFQNALSLAEQKFFDTLDYEEQEKFENVIKAFVEDSTLLNERDYFDLSIAQAFILERVFTLGWNKELHGEYDFRITRYEPVSRTSNKPERIGKKYQWIAYRELLARVSDNFEYVGGITGEGREYKGTWQLSDSRDIDPSCILKKTGYEGWGIHEKTWWFPYEYTTWDEPVGDVEWLKKTNDLPDFSTLIEVPDHENNKWITLEGHYNLEQPTPPEEDKYELERRNMWFSVKSYIVRKDDIDKIYEWAKRQDFWGDWMPKSDDVDVFLGEFFWSPAFKYFQDPYYGQSGWGKGNDERRGVPCDVLITTTSYFSQKSGYDCSIDEGFRICIPAKEIVQEMNLNWAGYEGEWCDAQNNLLAFDPSVREKGPGCMLIRKENLLSYLNDKEYDILWIIIGAKSMLGGSMYSAQRFKGELKINGAARLEEDKVFTSISTIFQSPKRQ